MTLKDEVSQRHLPDLLRLLDGRTVNTAELWQQRREEIAGILSGEFAGYPTRLRVSTEKKVMRCEKDSYGGKAMTEHCLLIIRSDFSEAAFPFTLTIPKGKNPAPFFVYLAFTPSPADGIGEEIADAGYALASVCYQDIAADYFDNHMTGLGRFCTRNPYDSWGKLRIWSWAASRILDGLTGDERLDFERAAVMGHSRLGKTALLAGAFDERFALTVSCQSGAGGAALFRGKTGERIENLRGEGSRLWFDGNFFQHSEETLPFDQHFLLAMIAPRYLYVTSASEDNWADPKSEFLSCIAASEAFELLGTEGLRHGGEFPETGTCLHEGHIGYSLRRGTHYLSRDDWKNVIAYREKHMI